MESSVSLAMASRSACGGGPWFSAAFTIERNCMACVSPRRFGFGTRREPWLSLHDERGALQSTGLVSAWCGGGTQWSGRGRVRADGAAAPQLRGIGRAGEQVIVHGHDHGYEDHAVVEQVQLESRDPQLHDAGGSGGPEQCPARDDLTL